MLPQRSGLKKEKKVILAVHNPMGGGGRKAVSTQSGGILLGF